ncbi:MAG: serine protease [Deltaproteobacteria bacterium]|nr:serine protease [Deltaproteobacteria bacterium]
MKKSVLILCALFFSLCSQALYAAEQPLTSSSSFLAAPQIIGGYEAPVAYPWMTAILHASESNLYQAQYCGGALIAPNWVLTAGHCVDSNIATSVNKASDLEVAVGVHDLNNWSGTRIQVKQIVKHPFYKVYYDANNNLVNIANDIALLELNSPSEQQPIPIFSGASVQGIDPKLLNYLTTLIGWGVYVLPDLYPSILQQVNLPVVADAYCNSAYGVTLSGSQLCAGYAAAKDACSGDSGGPMMLVIDGQWVHVGLVSYGSDCKLSNGYYGVYTRSSAFVDFIKQYVPAAKFTPVTAPKSLPWLMLLLHNP